MERSWPPEGGSDARNVLGGPLEPCSYRPLTGFLRDGCCNTNAQDFGLHTVCVVVTEDFLQFSMHCGNDLTTPHPEYDFPGLNPGDRWCLCAARWLEAYEAGMAPHVVLSATNLVTLRAVPLEYLKQYAIDLS